MAGGIEHGVLFIRMVREVPSNKAACENKPEGSEQATKLREQEGSRERQGERKGPWEEEQEVRVGSRTGRGQGLVTNSPAGTWEGLCLWSVHPFPVTVVTSSTNSAA